MTTYANYYDYITGTGVIVPDTSKILEEVVEEWKEVFGDQLNTDPETPQGRIIEMIARQRVFTVQMAAALSNVLNLNKAYGFILDDIGSLFQLKRQSATYTTTQITMSGVADTVIPIGTELMSDAGDKFVNDYEYVIGSNGSVTGMFRAEETGSIQAPVGTITTVISQVSGLETVINNASAEVGQDQESDQEFRNRIKASLNINSTSVLSAIKSAIADVSGVNQVKVYENTGSTDMVLATDFKIPGHSFGAIVDYNEVDLVNEPITYGIIEAIYKKKSLGAGYITYATSAGEDYIITRGYIDDNDGQTHNVSFAIPKTANVAVEISVDKKNYAGDDLEGDIKNAIENFISGNNPEVDRVEIGGVLSPFEIASAVSSEIPDIFISSVTIGRVGSAQSTSNIQLTAVEKLVIAPENITVTIS